MSTVYDCNQTESRALGITAAVQAVRAGRLVVLPTDTVYGIGCDAFDSHAVSALLEAKGRGREMPVPVLVGSWTTIDGLLLSVPAQTRALVEAFWPGGLSIVVEHAPSLSWDLGYTRGTVMLRMPLHPVALEVLREVGPMGVSSANKSGHPATTNVADAQAQLGHSVAVYLDGGESQHGVASTIVDLTGAVPRILREGAVATEAVAEVLGMNSSDLTEPAQ